MRAPSAVRTSSSAARVGLRPMRIENQAGAGEERGGAEKECGGRDVAGDSGIDGVKRLRAGDGDGIDGARERGAEGAQGQFAVVAGADCFAHGGGAGGLQTGKQDAGLDLRAGDRRGVVDGVKRRAVDGDGRVAVGEREARAHRFERLANALHGAARERCVADEGEGACCGASRPEIMRMVEPELPQSSG